MFNSYRSERVEHFQLVHLAEGKVFWANWFPFPSGEEEQSLLRLDSMLLQAGTNIFVPLVQIFVPVYLAERPFSQSLALRTFFLSFLGFLSFFVLGQTDTNQSGRSVVPGWL